MRSTNEYDIEISAMITALDEQEPDLTNYANILEEIKSTNQFFNEMQREPDYSETLYGSHYKNFENIKIKIINKIYEKFSLWKEGELKTLTPLKLKRINKALSSISPDSEEEKSLKSIIENHIKPFQPKAKIEAYKNDYNRHYTNPFVKGENEFKLKEEAKSCGGTQGGRTYWKNGKHGKVSFFIKHYDSISFKCSMALNEKIFADFYRLLSGDEYYVPKTKLKFNDEKVEVASRFVDKLILLEKVITNKEGQYYTDHNEEEVPLNGYVRLKTIAAFLGDSDWDGRNAGYVIDDFSGLPKCVKLDPGLALRPLIWGDHRPVGVEVNFDIEDFDPKYKDTPCQNELFRAIQDIINLSDEQIEYLVKGDGNKRDFNRNELIKDHERKGEETLNEHLDNVSKLLIARRDFVKEHYESYLKTREFKLN